MDAKKMIEALIDLPADYQLTSEEHETRNKQDVAIFRYQYHGDYTYNGPRVIALFQEEMLVSLKNLTTVPNGKHLSTDQIRPLAESIMKTVNPRYALGLAFVRIERQQRGFVDTDGKSKQFPVFWVKFAHSNGSYNWVTLAEDGSIIEMEIDSRWDYLHGRRKTEMWDNDDWVLARKGKGPQLDRPNALA